MLIEFGLFSIVVLIVFAAAWRWFPSGYLTACIGSVPAIVIAAQEVFGEHMPALKAVVPTEYQPWLLVTFMVLTVAARFRSKASA